MDLGLLTEVSGSHLDTPHSVGLLWASERPVTGISIWQYSQDGDIHAPAGFEPSIPASKRAQTYTLDNTAIGIGDYLTKNKILPDRQY
jgi:hypothetical protein